MLFKFDLFSSILWLGVVCGSIATLCIQKIKETKFIQNKKKLTLLSAIIDFIIGIFITLVFTNLTFSKALCVGLFTYIGAETIYSKLKSNNLMKSLQEIIIEEQPK